jgi:hypothetical protein
MKAYHGEPRRLFRANWRDVIGFRDARCAKAPKVGDTIHFRLFSGLNEVGVIRSILKATSGSTFRIEYGTGKYIATISVDQIVRPPNEPKDDIKF